MNFNVNLDAAPQMTNSNWRPIKAGIANLMLCRIELC